VKFSSCVDCATPIIGEQLRCPACHDRHSKQLLLAGDEDVTLPRDRSRQQLSMGQALLAWFVLVQVLAVVVIVLIFVGRACR
jgi:hypothetical protein